MVMLPMAREKVMIVLINLEGKDLMLSHLLTLITPSNTPTKF